MRPVLLCALNNGNDVLMRHVEAGAQRNVAAGDGDEHGVVADALKRAHAHDVGVACLDVRVQLVELRVVRPAVVKVVDGLAPDGGGQARGRALAVQVGIIALQGKDKTGYPCVSRGFYKYGCELFIVLSCTFYKDPFSFVHDIDCRIHITIHSVSTFTVINSFR